MSIKGDFTLHITRINNSGGKQFSVVYNHRKQLLSFKTMMIVMFGICCQLLFNMDMDIYMSVVALSFIILLICGLQIHTESILVLPFFGIAFETVYCWDAFKRFISHDNHKRHRRRQWQWIKWETIESIIINEGIRLCVAHYYLAIKIRKSNHRHNHNNDNHSIAYHLPFKHFIPRLPILLPIYQQIKQILIQTNNIREEQQQQQQQQLQQQRRHNHHIDHNHILDGNGNGNGNGNDSSVI